MPALHLVGASVPPGRTAPSQWEPTLPPLQHGIDYTFLGHVNREPVRWRHGSSITVRLAGLTGGQLASTADGALSTVVAELRVLTGLHLIIGVPCPLFTDPAAIPHQEIHVGYLKSGMVAVLPARSADRAGVGGARRDAQGRWYLSGFAIVNADIARADAMSGHALAILRHELGHALGLGHAARRSLIMHDPPAADVTGYGRGDRRGLELLGRAPRAMAETPRNSQPVRTPPCAV